MMGRGIQNRVAVVPALLLLLLLAYDWINVLRQALRPAAQARPQDGLPVSPEFAFGWLQAAAGGGMLLVLLWAVVLMFRSLRLTDEGIRLPWQMPRVLAAAVLVCFAAPAWWLWFWAVLDWLAARQTVDFSDWRYVAAAVCQPFLLWLPWRVWRGQRQLRRMERQEA